jgi:predicted MFS family arabinose efflux permease
VAAAGGAPLGQYFREYRRILAVPSVVSLHACITLNAVGWVAWMTFVGAFFIQRYGMATEQLSIVNAALGLGGVVGSALGGRIADRWLGHRRLVIWTAFVTGPLIVAQTNLIALLPLALVVNPFLSAPMGARFAGMITLLSEQNPEARGRLLSLNTNGFQTGVVIGAAVGGMVLESWGYGTLGLMAGGLMMLSSLPVAIWAREGPRARTLET